MLVSDVVGWIAIILSAMVAIPQAILIYRRKSARDVSLSTILLVVAANVAWIVYAEMVGDQIVAISCVVGLAIIMVELALFIRYRKNQT